MKKVRFNISLFAMGLTVLSSCSHNGQPTNRYEYAISNVNIIDIENGVVLPHQNVRIKNERIVDISSNANFPKSITLINGTDKYLIPGLWDMHMHYYWNYRVSNPLLIANGIIGIREMFGDIDTIKYIRNEVKNKRFVAPEIISSGLIIDGVPPIWPGSDTISNPTQAEAIVSKQVAQGVDFLKVYSMLTKVNYMAIAREANAKNIPFAGHVPDDVTIWEAIAVKQRSMEHLFGFLEACTKSPGKLALYKTAKYPSVEKMNFLMNTFDGVKFDSLLKVVAQSDSWICPTLTVLKGMGQKGSDSLNFDRSKYLPSYITDYWKNQEGAEVLQAFEKQYEFEKGWMGKMKHAGVKIIAGTDSPNPQCYPGFSLHDELSLMVEGGMSPFEALQTATINPALFLKREKDYGSVAVGKFASIVLLNKNPLDNINNTKDIYCVFLKGEYFSKDSLISLLKSASMRN